MTIYLLLIVFFGIIFLISVCLFIFFLVKKKRNFAITAMILFLVSVLGGTYSGIMYSRKMYEYLSSKDFQDDAKKGSELLGQTAGSISSGLSKGLATSLDDSAIAALAKKSATIIGRSIKTIASGLDSTIGNKNIFIDQNLDGTGIELGRAEEDYKTKENDLGIFITYKKAFKGKLKLTNYDQTGKIIDVAEKIIDAKSGEDKVEVFTFLHTDMGITTYYILSKEN